MMTLHDLLAADEVARQTARDHTTLSASGAIPICDRQTALRLAAEPPTDPVEPVTAATVGTLIHEAVARLWAVADPDAQVERKGAHGTADVVRPGSLEVRDLKTVRGSVFDQWALDGPPDSVWTQLRIYGHDVDAAPGWTLVVDVLCREDGRTATYTKPYHPDDGQQAVAALADVEADLKGLESPWHAEPSGSWGADWVCERCPFRTPCGRGLRRDAEPLAVDDPAAVDAVADYLHGKQMEKDAKALKGRAKAALVGVEGRVGGYTVKWVTRTMPEHTRAAYDMTYVDIRKARP